MECPFCRTENREDRDTCYHCDKDLSMLRLIVHKARTHFNNALELAERSRDEEAVAELQNALDLDHSHAPSHVVLGSLYARLGQMDRAEECWREALRLNPQIQKAHEYLGKVKTVRRSLPLVFRQQVLIVFLVVVLVCLGFFLWRLGAPNRNRERLEAVWQLYQSGRYRDVLSKAREASQVREPDLYVTSTALVGDLVRAEETVAVKATRTHLAAGDYVTAARQARAMLAREPSDKVRVRLTAALGETAQLARRAVMDALAAFAEGRGDEGAIEKAIAVYQGVAGDDADADLVAQAGRRIEQVRRDREIRTTLARCNRPDADAWACLEDLWALRRKYPEDARPAEAFETIAQPIRARHMTDFEERLESGDLSGAAAALKPLGRIFRYTSPGEATDRIRALERRIADARGQRQARARAEAVGQLESRMRRSYEAGDYENAVQAAEGLLRVEGVGDTTRAVAEKMLARSHTQLADARWRWMAERARDYIDARIDLDTAEKTIRWYPQVEEHLSSRVYPTSRDNLLFFLAMAYRKLDRDAEYREALGRLVEKYPDSNYMRWVRHYAKKDSVKLPH